MCLLVAFSFPNSFQKSIGLKRFGSFCESLFLLVAFSFPFTRIDLKRSCSFCESLILLVAFSFQNSLEKSIDLKLLVGSFVLQVVFSKYGGGSNCMLSCIYA